MHIDPHFVGTQLREHHLVLTERQCMNFAAGVGDANPVYFDDERPGGLIAHPLLATAITWQVAGKIWEFLPPGDFPTDLLLTQVHYSEHLLFHQPLRPGLRLTLHGKVAAILPHRAGTQVVVRFEALDDRDVPIFSEYTGGLLRGVICEPPGLGGQDLPALPRPFVNAPPLWIEPLHFDTLSPYIYDACADIHFPIHTSPRFAHQVGLPGVIIQGTQLLAKAAMGLVQHQPVDPPYRLAELACRFNTMVFPGETLNLRLEAEQPAHNGTCLFFDVLKIGSEPVLRHGYARLVPEN